MTGEGPLAGVRVVELCDESGAFAGKLLADLGADVIKIEPPDGDPTRTYPPFLDDVPGAERSLYFWHYNTSKRSAIIDLQDASGLATLRRLIERADVFLTTDEPRRLALLGVDWNEALKANPRLVMASIRPFGREAPRADEAATDLTLLAGGGPAWNCGYDDHSLPPVRGGGNQGYQTGCHYAVMCVLTALLSRDVTGEGQLIDVNIHAACNVTTEAGSYTWLVARQTVQRQTGRHASQNLTMPSQVACADGRYVNTGIPPRRPEEFARVLQWLETLGLREAFPAAPLLEAGELRERIDLSRIAEDPEVAAIFGAGREAVNFIAARVPAYDFFTGAQERGFQVGIVYAPEDVLEDPHFIARGFRVEVEHPELGRTFTYPGAPIRFTQSPWRIQRRPPLVGEHTAEVLAELR